MKPFPLKNDEGLIYLYGCGLCHNVIPGGWSSSRRSMPHSVEISFSKASQCCLCQDCGQVVEETGCGNRCPECEKKNDAEMEAEIEAYRAARAPKEAELAATVLVSKDPHAAACLRYLMREISEDSWCAGWMSGLEYELWEAVLEAKGRPLVEQQSWGGENAVRPVEEGEAGHAMALYGLSPIADHEAKELLRLHLAAGGWWVWDAVLIGEKFVSTEQWRDLYAEHLTKLADRVVDETIGPMADGTTTGEDHE